MTPRFHTIRGIATLLASASFCACQGYELNPVVPHSIQATTQTQKVTGNQQAPNVMIVLDESGSMEEPASLNGVTDPCGSGNPVCCTQTGNYGNWCPASQNGTCANPCKWDDAVTALTGFLSAAAMTQAQFGFVGFPIDAECGAGQVTTQDMHYLPLGTPPATIASTISGSTPGGGTPTAQTLTAVGSIPNFVQAGRASYVLLVTDGLPNCNPNNAQLCANCNNNPSTCTCTLNSDGTDACCNPTTSANCGSGALNQCLDGAAAVASVKALATQGIQTIVVGFGAEAALNGYLAGPVLNAMANAGGLAGYCGGATSYCSAQNATGLQNVLNLLTSLLQTCSYTLNGTFDPSTLVVDVEQSGGGTTKLNEGTDYTLSGNTLNIIGQWCTTLKSAKPNTYTLQFSYAQTI
jgi:hypothetical protein